MDKICREGAGSCPGSEMGSVFKLPSSFPKFPPPADPSLTLTRSQLISDPARLHRGRHHVPLLQHRCLPLPVPLHLERDGVPQLHQRWGRRPIRLVCSSGGRRWCACERQVLKKIRKSQTFLELIIFAQLQVGGLQHGHLCRADGPACLPAD